MTIKKKLMLVGLIVFISMMGIIIAGQYAMNHVLKAQEVEQALGVIRKDITLLSRTKLSFLVNVDKKYEAEFAQEYKDVKEHLELVNEPIVAFGMDPTIKKDLVQSIDAYNDAFVKLYTVQKRIGFDKEDALYGSMRKAAHAFEDKVKAYGEHELHASALQMRRHEKDFMLRQDEQYIGKFDSEYQNAMSLINNASGADKQQLKSLLTKYKDGFNELSKQMKIKGLDKKSGLIGQMNTYSDESNQLLNKLVDEMHKIIVEDVGSVDKLIWMIDLFGIIAMCVVLAVLAFIGTDIVKSVESMRDLMRKVASTKDLTLRYKVKEGANDGVSLTGVALNDMLGTFQNVINNVNDSTVQMSESADTLAANALQTSAGAKHQSNQISRLAQSMDEMIGTIDVITNSVNNSAQITKDTNNDCQEGQKVVASSANSIKALESSISVASQSIQKLQQDSESIGSVLDVIRGIAEQTNLLALNAAIEAARAGEQGRGFAVVADEVRTLAGRTQNSTTEIQEMIESLQSVSLEAVSIMDKSLKDTKQGVEEVMKTDESLKRIVESVSNLNDINTQIATLAEQQKASSLEINNSVQVINQVSTDSAQGAEESAESSKGLSTLAHHLSDISSQFKV